MMNVRFSKWGNSIALRIPNSFARDLHIFDGKSADIQIKDGALVVTPVDVAPTFDINDLVAQISAENVHAETDTGDAVGNESF